MNDISKRLKIIALDKGIKIRDVAAKTGQKQTTFSVKFSRGIRSIDDLNKILDALGCDMVFVDRNTKKVY